MAASFSNWSRYEYSPLRVVYGKEQPELLNAYLEANCNTIGLYLKKTPA